MVTVKSFRRRALLTFFRKFVIFLLVAFLSSQTSYAMASTTWGCTKNYSAYVKSAAGYVDKGTALAVHGELITGVFALKVAAVGGAAIVGTGVGEGVNWILTRWWDPVNPIESTVVYGPIYTGITDAQIDALIPTMFSNAGSPLTITKDDILSADDLNPGLGTHSLAFLRSGVRLSVMSLQGAAAYNAERYDEVEQAASDIEAELDTYENETRELANHLRTTQVELEDSSFAPLETSGAVEGVLPATTITDYDQFISDVTSLGAAELPPGEVANVELLISTAKTSVPGNVGTLIADFVADDSEPQTCSDPEKSLYTDDPDGILSLSDTQLGGISTFLDNILLSESPLLMMTTGYKTSWQVFLGLLALILGFAMMRKTKVSRV